MKRKGICWLLTLLCAVCCLFVGCVGTNDPANTPTEITLEISKEQLTLERLENYQLTVTANGKTVSGTWSSHNTEVATVENGLVTALGEGTALIYVTYQGVQERCVVTVEDHKYLPMITVGNLDEDELGVVVGDTFTVETSVSYNQKVCGDAQISYALEGADGVATLDGATITGVGKGSVTLVIEATWRGVTVTKTLPVNVVTNFSAQLLDEAELTLYATALDGEKTSQALNVTVYEQQAELTEGQYTLANWDYDEKIISYMDGMLTAVGAGKTTLSVEVTSVVTGDTVTVELPVEVLRVERDKTETIELAPVDLSVAENSYGVADVFTDLEESAYNGQTIVKIEDVTDEASVLGIAYANGVVNVDESLLGERVWKVYTEKIAYRVRVVVATKVITTAAEFNQMQTAYGNAATKDNGYAWGGYFTIADDLDMGGETVAIKSLNRAGNAQTAEDGFHGTFNGRGYALKNFVIAPYTGATEAGSLFGSIGENGVVKNLTVKEYTIKNGSTTDSSASVAWAINGGAIENINVVYTGSDFSLQHGYLAHLLGGGTVLKDINVFSSMALNYGFGVATLLNSQVYTLENVNVVIANNRLIGMESNSKLIEPSVNFMYFNHSMFNYGETKSLMSKKAVDWVKFGFYNANIVDGATVTEDGALTVADTCAATTLNVTVISSLGGVAKAVNAAMTEAVVDVFKFTAATDITVTPVSGDTGYVNLPQATGGIFIQLQPATQESRWTFTLPKIDFTKYEKVSFTVQMANVAGAIYFGETKKTLATNAIYTIAIKDEDGTYKVYFGEDYVADLTNDVKNGAAGFSFDASRAKNKWETFILSSLIGKEKKEAVTE